MGLTYLVELNDVGVSDFLQDVDFTSHTLHVPFVFDAVLLQDLYRHFLTCDCVRSDPHFAESSRAE